ncbi:MAG: MDR/zinc-dependent alcohol dehydrogenase-like family protein [Vicinamibacterales bacterium]
MHALVAADGHLDLQDVARPSFPQECLIRIRMAGICGTDLAILAGYAGFSGVPGHEFVGVVERAPGEAETWLGRRVVGEINIGCGLCRSCREGVREHCERRRVVGIRDRDGAFAEYLSLPAENLHAVPDHMPDEVAVFAEPLAAACRIVEQLPHVWRPASPGPPATDAAVLGDGRLGLLVAQVLLSAGARVTVIGRHAEKLAIARGFGVETMTADEMGAARGRFELVVDATGRPGGLASALALVRPRGTVVLKSTFHGAVPIATSPIVVDEVTIVGSRCGPFPKAIDLLSRGAVDVRPLVSAVYPLSAWRDAFSAARTMLKVLIEPASFQL